MAPTSDCVIITRRPQADVVISSMRLPRSLRSLAKTTIIVRDSVPAGIGVLISDGE
jgi:hypothetical protein